MRIVWKVMPRLAGAVLFSFLSVAHGQNGTLLPRKTPQPRYSPPNLRTGNSVIAVQAAASGFFSIGTANDRALLYDFPFADYRSHVNVWLDGRLYSNDSARTKLSAMTQLRAPEILGNGALVCWYGFEALLLEQRLLPEQYSDSTGAIFIQYVLTNPTAIAREVGLLLELDTKVNDNDKTPFLTNFGYRSDEVVFQSDSIPDFLQAFENLPPAPGLVAKFTLTGANATRPDLIGIGDWVNLSKVQWNFTPAPIPYNDSAVLLRWNPVRLGPGETRTFGAYYGVGEVSSRTDTLTLSVIAPERLLVQSDTLTPNPFTVSALVTNTGFATAHNVRARLLLPNGLQLAAGESAIKELTPRDLSSRASGATTWKVAAQCATLDSNFHVHVEVFAGDAPGNAVTRTLFVPNCFGSGFTLAVQPRAQTLAAGANANVVVQLLPRGNFNEEATLSLWPSLPGFDFTFSTTRLRPGASAQLTIATNNTLFPGEYHFVLTAASAAQQATDTLTLQITPVVLDVAPPFTRGHNPALDARNVLPETPILVEVHDAGAGVDTTALVMSVNGVRVTPKLFWFDEKRVQLSYQPPSPFHYNEAVRVTVRAQDLASPANVMPEENYVFHIVEDFTPPFVTDHMPPRNAQRVAANTAISFHVRDELAGVDSNALALEVNGIAVKPAFSGTLRDFFVHYQPPQPFAWNEQVTVRIRARDLSFPPNEMPEENYAFTVVQDLTPPLLTDLQPPRNAERVAATTAISFHLRDEIAGVDSNALVLTIDGANVKPKLSGTRHDWFVFYQPAAPFRKGQNVSVRIAAQDLSAPPNVMLPEQFSFRIEEPVYDLIAERVQPNGPLRAGVLTTIVGEVRNGFDAVTQPVRARLLADGVSVKDTLFVAQVAGQLTAVHGQVRFADAGRHEIILQVDDENRLAELSENNNQQSLLVEIAPPLVREFTVRPNPFTPNEDGFNDAVEFNFSTLNLSAPALRIFDVEGRAVVQEENLSSGVFVWRGRDRNGRALPPGIYLYSLQERGKNLANGHIVLAR